MKSHHTALDTCRKMQKVMQHLLPKPGDYEIGINGLTLYWREETTEPEGEGCAAPHATVVFQGAECVFINGRAFTCGQCQCRLTGKEVYGTGHISAASSEEPFFAASLALDSTLLKAFSHAMPHVAEGGNREDLTVKDVDEKVLNAFYRLVLLHNQPERIRVLAPLIIYEIHYLLASGPGCAPFLQ